MTWFRAGKRDLPGLLQFLLEREWKAVPFTSRLCPRGEEKARLPGAVFLYRDHRRIKSALMLNSSGLLLPLLDSPQQTPQLPYLHRITTLHSIMGLTEDVTWTDKNLAYSSVVGIDYHLMRLTRARYRLNPVAKAVPPAGLTWRKACPGDTELLYPLQRDYELEEVTLDHRHFSERSCRAQLKRLLRDQIVLMAECHGRVVAKANTNARGIVTDQIGGIFTIPSQRNRGIAYWLLAELLEQIFLKKEAVSLFAKLANKPALAVYRRHGFKNAESYQIRYYQI